MNPDVLRGVEELRARGVLAGDTAELIRREESAERLSLYQEMRGLLYAGVLMIIGGIGVLVKDNIDQIGPVAIALGITIAAAAAIGWTARKSPPFSWGHVLAPNLAFDYILLLGVLLAAADLAYIESQFTALGENWPWHLFIVSVTMTAAGIRYDSRVVFALALSTFAAWRGISAATVAGGVARHGTDLIRANMLGCGVLFVIIGYFLVRSNRKSHFEPVALYPGWFLVLSAFAAGIAAGRGADEYLNGIALFSIGVVLSRVAYARRRFPLFAMGLCGACWAVGWIITKIFRPIPELMTLAFLGCAVAVVAGLMAAHKNMNEPQ